MRIVSAVAGAYLALIAGQGLAQQGGTLADIREDMRVLQSELVRLQQELSASGSARVGLDGSALDRMTTIESELQRVTAKTEELEYRLNRIVKDGTNRLGDLEFRLCEVEPECDISTLGRTSPLGGTAVTAAPAPAPAPMPATDALVYNGELAISEEADFTSARDALQSGDASGAASLFASFRETYPGSPLEPLALIGEGQALDAQGDTREAARRYLEAYSKHRDAAAAPEALWRLGMSLAALNSTPEACVALGQVSISYPGSDYVERAATSRAELGCQ